MGVPNATREELEAELRVVQAAIDGAYWAFTRQATASPPSTAVPEAYKRRAELLAELRKLVQVDEPQW